jgi:O-acetylhomoserine/O-acetylserine sulfhydrylase
LLEGGAAAVAASSGQAAQFMTISTLAGAGDNIVSTSYLYGEVSNPLRPSLRPMLTILRDVVLLKKYGITVKFVTSDDPSEFDAAIDENTKAIFLETIENPKYSVSPISEIAKVCDLYVGAPIHILRLHAGCTRAQSPADRQQYIWHGR